MATVLIEISDSAERQHRTTLRSLVDEVKGTVRIASAYVTDTGILSGSKGRDVRLLTYISRQDIIFGATSLNSLISLIEAGVKCRYLFEGPRLHAKVYMFGLQSAVVTSANLTRKALDHNLEVGVRLSGVAAAQLVIWFDTLWDAAEVLDSELAATWLRETQVEREQLSILQKSFEMQQALSTGKTKKLQQLFEGTNRFFVCNTNRRNSLNDEKSMHDRGYAAAWEKFNYPTHMDRVKAGDTICMYAKGEGIIGIGRAKGPAEKLESRARNRVVPDGEREWRVPTEWLVWKSDHPFRWNSPNATFFDISTDEYENLREGLKGHFSEFP
jgi:PLD-like domain